MKKVLLTTSAIVGLSVPAFAADPTAVSDQPYFPSFTSDDMVWKYVNCIDKLVNKDADDALPKGWKEKLHLLRHILDWYKVQTVNEEGAVSAW